MIEPVTLGETSRFILLATAEDLQGLADVGVVVVDRDQATRRRPDTDRSRGAGQGLHGNGRGPGPSPADAAGRDGRARAPNPGAAGPGTSCEVRETARSSRGADGRPRPPWSNVDREGLSARRGRSTGKAGHPAQINGPEDSNGLLACPAISPGRPRVLPQAAAYPIAEGVLWRGNFKRSAPSPPSPGKEVGQNLRELGKNHLAGGISEAPGSPGKDRVGIAVGLNDLENH